METSYKLRNAERLTRLVLGLGIVLSILITPLTPMGIFVVFLLSIYPLVTSLIAIDPIFRLINKTYSSEDEKNDYSEENGVRLEIVELSSIAAKLKGHLMRRAI